MKNDQETELREKQGKKLMRLLLVTVLISSMSALMFNIVLPQIGREFQLSLPQTSWLTTAYALIYALGTVTYGKLSDRFQIANVLTFGLLLFGAGSLIGFLSTTFPVALLGRCLQSAGAAVVPAMAMLIPIRYFPAEKRGSALSMTAVGIALGGALGPVVAAFLVSVADWRWLFVPSLLMVGLIPLYRKYLIREPLQAHRSFDWIGGLLLAAAVSLILLGVTDLEWLYGLGGAVALVLFGLRITAVKEGEAFVHPGLFRNRSYVVMLVLAALISGIGISLYFLTPILLAETYRLDGAWIGFAMVPAAVASAIMGRKGGGLADRKGNTYLFTVASGCLIACFLLLSSFAGIALPWIAAFLILGNVGQTFLQIALSGAVSRVLTKEEAGVGMGLFSLVNFITQGLAAGVYGVLASRGTQSNWNPLNGFADGQPFSNIYLVLMAVHIGILAYYRLRFGKTKANKAVAGIPR
jgi:DHA2 family metal-tetracycline-proton antiporter-like MFS transporter